MDERQFGLKIKARREELGLSQKDLAVALELDQGKVSLIERGGRKIDAVNEIPVLAKVLKKPVSWFYESLDDLEPEEEPIMDLLAEYFPGVPFTDFEARRIKQFLEPVVGSYVKNDPNLKKKLSNR